MNPNQPPSMCEGCGDIAAAALLTVFLLTALLLIGAYLFAPLFPNDDDDQ